MSSCGNRIVDQEIVEPTVENNSVQLTEMQLAKLDLEIGKLQHREISAMLVLNGKIDVPPQNKISVSVPLGGYLASTPLLPGMHVKKGEEIARIEGQQYIELQRDYLVIASKLNFAEKDLHRQEILNASKASSDKAHQQATAEYTALRVEHKSLSEKLKLVGISPDKLNEQTISRSVDVKSSIDGFVTNVNVNIGKYVNPSDILFELVNPEDIHLNLTVYEQDLGKLFIGQKLVANTISNPDKKYNLEIILISKDFSVDRSIEVLCHFEKYESNLIPGMFMNASIFYNTANVLAIPNEAIVLFNGKNYVFVDNGNFNYEMIEVEIGIKNGNYTAILNSDIFTNKNLIFKGAYSMLMALKNKEE
jgi:cobalt-zinc-cadmium efflux system membrane fusion protein